MTAAEAPNRALPASGDLGVLVLFVPGTPAPQGSKVRNRWAGVRDSNAATLHPWRDAVRHDVAATLPDGWQPVTGPVLLTLTFTLRRPTSLPKRVIHHTKKPDWDKLARAVCDSITDAGWWRDDSQVIRATVEKKYGERTGVQIEASMPAAHLKGMEKVSWP